MVVVSRQSVLTVLGWIVRIRVPGPEFVMPFRLEVWPGVIAIDHIGKCGYQDANLRRTFAAPGAHEEGDGVIVFPARQSGHIDAAMACHQEW